MEGAIVLNFVLSVVSTQVSPARTAGLLARKQTMPGTDRGYTIPSWTDGRVDYGPILSATSALTASMLCTCVPGAT
eukprot:3219004-Rhodomonas_salina.1